MLSKSDLSKLKKVFASKKDLSDLEKRMYMIFSTKDDLRKLEERVEERAEKRHSDIFNLVDGLAKSLVT